MTHNIFVDWSGKYPNLCGGEWTITIDGLPVNIPELLKHDRMNTFGTYSEWSFDKGDDRGMGRVRRR